MSQSATVSQAASRRQEARRRITRTARELALQHGLDGFTMDQLAERSEVSRRTLFNYFPGKNDALLGGGPVVSEESIEEFRSGGPSGDLIEDLLVLADEALSDRGESPEDAALGQRVLAHCPSLTAHACGVIDSALVEFLEHTRAREGDQLDVRAARALLRTLIALSHLTIDEYVETGGATPPAQLLRDHVADLRHLLT